MAGHSHLGSHQQYSHHQHYPSSTTTTTTTATSTPGPILTFHTCNCTYHSSIRAQQPLDPDRVLGLVSPSPPHSRSRHQSNSSCSCSSSSSSSPYHSSSFFPPAGPTPTLHLSGSCRIHECFQFLTVHNHIFLTMYPRLLDAKNCRADREVEAIREDYTDRVEGMAEKLVGRWEGVTVLLGEARGEGGGMLRFGGEGGFTEEERRMHGRGEMERVFWG